MPETTSSPTEKLIPSAKSAAQQSQAGGSGKTATRAESSKSNTRGVTFTTSEGNPATTATESNKSPQEEATGRVVGSAIDRVDARLKVTGAARYAADYPVPGVAFGVPIRSTISKGKIAGFDLQAAKAVPGVLEIITRENSPPTFRARNEFDTATKQGEKRQVFEDDLVHYAGQFIGLVVAETLEQAIEAHRLVNVRYEEEKALITTDEGLKAGVAYAPESFFGEKLQQKRGDIAAGLAASQAKVEAEYSTPIEHHNPMEMHAALAHWEGDSLTLYDATQWVVGSRNVVAESIGTPPEDVRIVSRYVGGGFGCKGFIWPHETLAAIAAKMLKRPVKVVLSRSDMFTTTGHRAETRQKIALGATSDGKLKAIKHETITQTSTVDEFVEPCAKTTTLLYACPNVETSYQLVPLNIGTPTPTRAPGESVGSFALESAMDELAYELKMDPIELRLVNYADVHPESQKQWSSKYLKECYAEGAKMIGWDRRKPTPGAARDGKWLVGLGMATATYPGMRSPGAAKVRINADGTVVVTSATQDIGTGTYTTMTMVAAQVLGVPVEKITVELGDSRLPPAPVSGGSMTTASVLPAVEFAANEALKKLIQVASEDKESPLHEAKPEDVTAVSDGKLALRGDNTKSESFQEILKRKHLAAIEGQSFAQPGEEQKKYAFHSFGAIFAEAAVDVDLGVVRLRRLACAFDIGRVINRKTGTSNLMGGIVWGVGMALFEHTVYDERNGRVITDNLADYVVPVNADIPHIDIAIIDKPDPYIGPQGARGLGEIGITGVAAAIANAVFNATGIRVRDLPITPDKLLERTRQIA